MKYQPFTERALPVLSVTPIVTKRGDIFLVVKWQLPSGEFQTVRFSTMSAVLDFVKCNIK